MWAMQIPESVSEKTYNATAASKIRIDTAAYYMIFRTSWDMKSLREIWFPKAIAFSGWDAESVQIKRNHSRDNRNPPKHLGDFEEIFSPVNCAFLCWGDGTRKHSCAYWKCESDEENQQTIVPLYNNIQPQEEDVMYNYSLFFHSPSSLFSLWGSVIFYFFPFGSDPVFYARARRLLVLTGWVLVSAEWLISLTQTLLKIQ